ncbi:MAG TPA: class I SAM-dependent methyltransferase [Kineosporiaceae bacterium]|nr:class I SAM-dependent methyltransferase [Kineosporiaceae bacterium]
MEPGRASRTAVFVCQGRAAADGRFAVGAFADPVAVELLTAEERVPVDRARSGMRPAGGRERLVVESVQACAEVVVPRTVVIDTAVTEAVRRHPDGQVVLLGAGLDTRPWRLPALAGVPVLSVDHPDSQADARRRTAVLPPPLCDLTFVPVDLAVMPLAPALQAAGHRASRPTAWVWEGVIPYLTRAAVAATVDGLTRVSGPGSLLIAQYQTRSLTVVLGRRLSAVAARLSGTRPLLAGEPWRSTWTGAQLARMLTGHGWSVASDESLLDASRRLGSPSGRSRSLGSGRITVAGR